MLKALEILETGTLNQVDFFEAVLVSGYGASMSKIDYEYRKIRQFAEREKYLKEDLKRRRRKLQIFMSKMKRDGLIEKVGNNGTEVRISEKGRQRIRDLRKRFPGRYYESEKQSRLTIISFDIPEKLRRKRDWLREVIRNLDFSMVHKSVWVGQVKIPQALIEDMDDLKILEYVEIFEISKTGTLRKT